LCDLGHGGRVSGLGFGQHCGEAGQACGRGYEQGPLLEQVRDEHHCESVRSRQLFGDVTEVGVHTGPLEGFHRHHPEHQSFMLYAFRLSDSWIAVKT
jgi:hypothetical protein